MYRFAIHVSTDLISINPFRIRANRAQLAWEELWHANCFCIGRTANGKGWNRGLKMTTNTLLPPASARRAIHDEALDQLFRQARSHNGWLHRPDPHALRPA